MAARPSGSQTSVDLLDSAGSCGCLAQLLGGVALLLAVVGLSLLLITGNPDRWQGIADPTAHPLALASGPGHPQTIWVGTEQGRILETHDDGQTWSETHQGLPAGTPITSLTLTPGGTQLLAGTSAGVYLSPDGGHSWQRSGTGIPLHTNVDAVAALPDGTVLAGTTSAGIYVSQSGGITWAPAGVGLPPNSDIYAFLALPKRGHVLAALIGGGIYASQDDGTTWTESDRGLPVAAGINVFTFLAASLQGSAVPLIFAGTSQGVYVSRDEGATWAPSSAGIGTTRVISLACDPLAPGDIVAGADTGVFQSRNAGVTWQPLGYGLPAEQHVGAVAVLHPRDSAQVILASVDQLYRYPGQWLLASEPWRALGIGAAALLALALVALVVWQLLALARAPSP